MLRWSSSGSYQTTTPRCQSSCLAIYTTAVFVENQLMTPAASCCSWRCCCQTDTSSFTLSLATTTAPASRSLAATSATTLPPARSTWQPLGMHAPPLSKLHSPSFLPLPPLPPSLVLSFPLSPPLPSPPPPPPPPCSPEVYRLDLCKGCFLTPLTTSARQVRSHRVKPFEGGGEKLKKLQRLSYLSRCFWKML